MRTTATDGRGAGFDCFPIEGHSQLNGDRNTDDRPPICLRCGVTMVPAALSADDNHEGDWVCLECEELDEEE